MKENIAPPTTQHASASIEPELGSYTILNVLSCSPLMIWVDINAVSIFLKDEFPSHVRDGGIDLQPMWDFLMRTPGIQQDVVYAFFAELPRHPLPWPIHLPREVLTSKAAQPSAPALASKPPSHAALSALDGLDLGDSADLAGDIFDWDEVELEFLSSEMPAAPSTPTPSTSSSAILAPAPKEPPATGSDSMWDVPAAVVKEGEEAWSEVMSKETPSASWFDEVPASAPETVDQVSPFLTSASEEAFAPSGQEPTIEWAEDMPEPEPSAALVRSSDPISRTAELAFEPIKQTAEMAFEANPSPSPIMAATPTEVKQTAEMAFDPSPHGATLEFGAAVPSQEQVVEVISAPGEELEVLFFEDLDTVFDDLQFDGLALEESLPIAPAEGGSSSFDQLLTDPAWLKQSQQSEEAEINRVVNALVGVLGSSPLSIWVNVDSFQKYISRRLPDYMIGDLVDLQPIWDNLNLIPGTQKAAVKGFFEELLRLSLPWRVCLPAALEDDPALSMMSGVISRKKLEQARQAVEEHKEKERQRQQEARAAAMAQQAKERKKPKARANVPVAGSRMEAPPPAPIHADMKNLFANRTAQSLDELDSVQVSFPGEDDDMAFDFAPPEVFESGRSSHLLPQATKSATQWAAASAPTRATKKGRPSSLEAFLEEASAPKAPSSIDADELIFEGQSPAFQRPGVIALLLAVIVCLVVAILVILPGALRKKPVTPTPDDTKKTAPRTPAVDRDIDVDTDLAPKPDKRKTPAADTKKKKKKSKATGDDDDSDDIDSANQSLDLE